jgi:hypothetical protein
MAFTLLGMLLMFPGIIYLIVVRSCSMLLSPAPHVIQCSEAKRLIVRGCIALNQMIIRRLVGGQRSKLDLMTLTRLYVSLFIIWAFTIFVYSYRFNVEVRRDDVVHAVEDQVKCSLLSGEECELETTFNHGLWFLSLIALTNMITLLFITLGTTRVRSHHQV